MARLIDADALKTIRSIQSADYNSIETIQHWIDNAPTVDAIPVEWLRDKMRGYASALKSTETAALVMVMQMWQKEQEAQE